MWELMRDDVPSLAADLRVILRDDPTVQ